MQREMAITDPACKGLSASLLHRKFEPRESKEGFTEFHRTRCAVDVCPWKGLPPAAGVQGRKASQLAVKLSHTWFSR